MEQDTSGCRKTFFDKKITFLVVVLVALVGSIFAVNQRLVWKKSAEGDGASPSLAGCRLIPSSLYGASEEEWKKYECVKGVAKLKTQTVLTGTGTPEGETLVENLQVPSIKSFASSVQTGDATVSYPIEVPPAAGGFAPSVSLNYSSSAVEDMRFNSTDQEWVDGVWSQGSYVGLGWGLSGIPQIFKNSAGRYYLIADGRSFELEGTDGQNNPNTIDKVSDDFVYTTKPNSHIRVIRKYRDTESSYQISTGPIPYKDAAVDYRSWDVWMKDGKHYHFEPLGFMPIKYKCNTLSGRERTWNPTDSDGVCRHVDDDGKTVVVTDGGGEQVKRLYNKWVLTEVQDTSGNKIAYEYSLSLDWEKNIDFNSPDGCRQKCLNDQPADNEKWEDCTVQCFNSPKTIDNNPFELGAARGGGYAYTFPNYDGTLDKRRVLFPRAIYPVSIKYGLGLRTGDVSQTNRIDFTYSKRDDNNYGPNKRQTGDRKLDEIKIRLGNKLIRSYKLEYTYSEAGSGYDSYTSTAKKVGQLLLASIKLKGAGETSVDFPVFQSYEYYPKGSVCLPNDCGSAESLLLKKANNGYGASVEYNYEKEKIGVYWEWENPQSPEIKADGVSDYREPTRLTRPRLISKTTRSSSNSQAQRTTYLYSNDREDGITCTDNTQTVDCHTNGHATLHLTGDFEFLGWSRVKEVLSSSENGTDFTDKIATYYNFNPGGYDIERGSHFKFYTRTVDSIDLPNFPGSENPYLKKGTLARKTTVKFEGDREVAISAETNTYKTTNVTDSAFNNIFFTSESKSCSDLDITTDTLRRGSFANLPVVPDNVSSISEYFDNYGNPIKQTEYAVKRCSADTGNKYYPTVEIEDKVAVKTTLSGYRVDVSDGKYIVDKPIFSELKEGDNGPSKSLTLISYNDSGLPTESLIVDNTMIGEGANKKGILSKINYDSYGSPIEKLSYKDYVSFTLAKSNGAWGYPTIVAPLNPITSTTAYDSTFQAFPKTTKTEPAPYNTTTTITYDFESGVTNVLGLPVSSTDPNGLIVKTVYDSFGRVVKKINPGDTDASPTVKYYYTDRTASANNPAMVVVVAKKNDATANDNSDSIGRLRSYTFYDDLGKKLQTQSQSTDPAKMFADETKYDSLSRPFKQISSVERTGTLGTYLNINVDSPSEYVTKTTYDTQGRAIRVKNPDGTCSITKYEGKKTYAIDPMKNLSSVEDGRFEIKDGELRSIKTAIAYDGGSVLGAATSSESVFAKINRYISTSTKAVKQLTGSNFCEGEIFNEPTLNITNVYTKQEAETNILGQTVVASVKEIKDLQDSVLSQTTSVYDGFGRVTETFDPDLGTNRILAYNALGQALKTEDNKRTVRSTTYDDLGRATATYEKDCYPDGTLRSICSPDPGTPGSPNNLKSKLTYDALSYGKALGKLVKEESSGGSTKEYFYQGLIGGQNIGLLSKTVYKAGAVLTEEVTYDEAGRVKTTSYIPGAGVIAAEWKTKETLTNQYDTIGRLKSISSNLGPDLTPGNYALIADISYDKFGLPTEKRYGNGAIERFEYDEGGKTLRLKRHTASKDGKDYMLLDYNAYDNAGNIKELKDNKLGEAAIRYEYDNFYRLTGVSGPYTASYDYDKLGRMTKKNEKENLTYKFDNFVDGFSKYYPLNAPKTVNETKLEYKDGNLTKTLSGVNLTYDSQNRLVKTEGGGPATKYTYDYSGQRTAKSENNGLILTYYVGNSEIIRELEGGPGRVIPAVKSITYRRNYPFGGLRVMKRVYSGGSWSDQKDFYNIFADHLSSTKAIVDQNGVDSLSKIDYYPYGSTRLEGVTSAK